MRKPILTIWCPRKNSLRLEGELVRVSGSITDAHISKVAKKLNIDETWLYRLVRLAEKKIRKDENHIIRVFKVKKPEALVEAPVEAPVATPVYIRGLEETADASVCIDSLELALGLRDLTCREPLIYWQSRDHLCAVDADFHHLVLADRPPADELHRLLVSFRPTPRFAWVTHGRGVRLIYEARDLYTAEELAAVASIRVLERLPRCTVELKTITRHPLYPNASGRTCGEVLVREQTADLAPCLGLFEEGKDYDPEAAEQMLEEHGYVIGQRYPHDRCPIDPTSTSHGDPVAVYPNGIYCFGCAGHGVRRGRYAPGWFPYSLFVGRPGTSVLASLVEGWVHWEHARFILSAHANLPEAVLRGAYRASLKARHGSDPRVAMVFEAGRDLVRFERRWGTLNGETFAASRSDAIIAKLPACKYMAESGKLRTDAEKVARLVQPLTSSRYGYYHLQPIWGHRIASYKRPEEAKYPYNIVLFRGPGEQPRYVPARERLSETLMWAPIQNAFPGFNRELIQLLLAAKGCAEADGTFPPFIFITGPTSSAKSTSVVLAASIAGDRVTEVVMGSNDERVRQAVLSAKESGSFVVFNEAVKEGKRRGVTKDQAMEFALSLTPTSTSHRLYSGSTELGQLPVFVWTDTYLPVEIKKHAQLARRIVHVYLPSSVSWGRSMQDTGVGRAEWLRQADAEYTHAANCILSDVIDRFFGVPRPFDAIARDLGFLTLAESPEAALQTQTLKTFYQLWRGAEKGDDGSALIDLNGADALSQMWRDICDEGYRSSQRCSETDWQKVVGSERPLRFSAIPKNNSKLYISFEVL